MVHQMEDITLVLDREGDHVQSMIRLESLPPLPRPTSCLSWCSGRRPPPEQGTIYGPGGATIRGFGGHKRRQVKRNFGVDLPFLGGIKVRSGMLGGRPTVGVGKEVTKNVSVFAGRNLNEERGVYEQQVGIQYKVNKNLSVESQLGHRNSGADVLFNYDF